jgi:hypothetical protein
MSYLLTMQCSQPAPMAAVGCDRHKPSLPPAPARPEPISLLYAAKTLEASAKRAGWRRRRGLWLCPACLSPQPAMKALAAPQPVQASIPRVPIIRSNQ